MDEKWYKSKKRLFTMRDDTLNATCARLDKEAVERFFPKKGPVIHFYWMMHDALLMKTAEGCSE